ncbi:MAG: CtsR family transcriptional regulator [Bacillota bacterium]
MANLSDQIEEYLKDLIKQYKGKVEIQRNQLANDFDCAPSQINYVLQTRFPLERGYVVESQRGGGGYIRIIRIKINSKKEFLQRIISKINGPVSQNEAESIISRLYENSFINIREKLLMETIVNKKIIGINLTHRDYVRGRILIAMMEVILKDNKSGEAD